jgi:hypothetical protein
MAFLEMHKDMHKDSISTRDDEAMVSWRMPLHC